MADTDAITVLSEHQRDRSRSAPAGSDPNAWQLVLWRLLALVAHAMRPSADNTRWSTALSGYVRRHPVRGAAYVAAAWFGAFLVIELMMLPVVVLLESLHFRPRGAADFGSTLLALCAVFALWFAAGRWLRHVVAARVNRWRTARASGSRLRVPRSRPTPPPPKPRYRLTPNGPVRID